MKTALRPISFRLVTSSYLPILGGSEIEAQRVCAALIRRGHRAEVFCPGGPPMPAETRRVDPCGIPVHQFGTMNHGRLRGYAFALASAWTLFRERSQYDVVYFLMTGMQVVTGAVVAKLLGKPILMKFSGSNTIRPLLASPVGRLQLKLLSRWAFRIMVLNAGMVEEGKECGLDPSKFMWMPNPVDTEQFCLVPRSVRADLRKQLGVDEEAEIILFVGRLAPEKELESLIEAFAQIASQRERVRLVLVGDGPLRNALQTLVEKRGLRQQVAFPGPLPASEVLRWLQAADIFALVSSVEGLPVSLIEAMAVGLPSVVSDIPASTQLIESGSNGLVAKLRDAGSLSRALLRLLEDPEMRACMGLAARRRVEHDYSTATVVGMYEQLFSEALAGGRASR